MFVLSQPQVLAILCLATFSLCSATAQEGGDSDCGAADFPLFNIPIGQTCDTAADCPSGQGCEAPLEDWLERSSGPVCSDYSASFGEACDSPVGPVMASPGCKQDAGISCDVDYNARNGVEGSAVCRKRIKEACASDDDCVTSWMKAPGVTCQYGRCLQVGYVEECSEIGARCAGGQVCTYQDGSQWISGSEARYACFNRADRGEACKGNFDNSSNDGYQCQGDDETAEKGYSLFCDGSSGLGNELSLGVCRSSTNVEGAACGENILCSGMNCVDGKCVIPEKTPGNECSQTSDCEGGGEPAPDVECSNGRCVALGFVGECFKPDEKCVGGQTCWAVPSKEGSRRNSLCFNRAPKGGLCKSPRSGPFNGYSCQPKSETGYDMRCIFKSDAVALPGPGPGGIGGGIAGTGLCMEVAEAEGSDCGDDILTTCDWSSSCVDRKCAKDQQ